MKKVLTLFGFVRFTWDVVVALVWTSAQEMSV